MRKIVLFISMISFVFSNAQTKLEKDYNNLSDDGDKLDFIFKHIIKKQITDYNLLKKEIETLKTENERLILVEKDRNQKIQKITNLRNEKNELLETKNLQTININNITKEKENLQKKLDNLKIKRTKEKENIRKAINSIIKQNSSKSSGKLAEVIKEMAEEYDDIETSDLQRYIDMNKIFVTAKNVLNKAYDDISINKTIDDLENLNINNKFSGLLEENARVTDLLFNYQFMCQDLSKLFQKYIDLGANAKYIKESLAPKAKEYIDYPYLSLIITKKLKSPIKTNFKGCN
jgi:hypothetical protein